MTCHDILKFPLMQKRDFPCTGQGLSVTSLSYTARISVTMFNVNNVLISSYVRYEIICISLKYFENKKRKKGEDVFQQFQG